MAGRGEVDKALARARSKAMRLLRVKLRSAFELRERLTAAGFGERDIEIAVGELKRAKVLDDRVLAEAEVRRMKERGPAGANAIRARLARRGLALDGLEANVESTGADVTAFAKKKLASMDSKLSSQAKARRLHAVLARRGIEEDLARSVVAKLTGESQDD